MNNQFPFDNGDEVRFDTGTIRGVGNVVGISTTPQPIIGYGVIVKVKESDISLPNDTYPFSTIVIFEKFLHLVK